MGTVNYGTSDYITMGINPYDYYDFRNDKGYMEDLREVFSELDIELTEGNIDNFIYEDISECYSCDKLNYESLREKYSFHYFDITLNSGYYEGLYVDIEPNYGIAYNDYEDKKEAQKEVTEIKAFLKELAGIGFVSCYPSWCTGYQDYKGTLSDIDEAIKVMREDIKSTPTWRQYERELA